MHISLDSALGRQRRLNSLGESITQIAPDPAAAYSLRSLTGSDPKVVRVRRGSDNHEQDFTASEVSSGALVDFVNAQVTAPLDIQELTATGRDGDFLIAKAAYSLRSLGTRQATVAATGDTVARADGKYVCQVRRSSDDALKSFTADEVTDGTLLSFTNEDSTQYMQFDGSDDDIDVNAALLPATDNFTLTINAIVETNPASNQNIFGQGSVGTNGRMVVQVQPDGTAEIFIATFGVLTTSNAVNLNKINTFVFSRSGTTFSLQLNDGTAVTGTSSAAIQQINSTIGGAYAGANFEGVITSLSVGSTTWDGTVSNASSQGWTVNGSPSSAVLNDGFVKTWYDQSVTTQAGDTATGNHATQATAAEQPKIVDAGSLITGGGIAFDGSDDQLDFTALNATDLAIFSVVKFDSVSGQERIVGEDSSNSEGFGIGSATTGFFRGNGGSSSGPALNATVSTSGDFLYSANRASNTLGFFTNGVASATVTNSDAFKANSIGGSTNPIDGNVKEIIIYETDQTDNRTAIEANMGEVYSIDLPSGVDPGFDQVDGFVETWYDQSGNGNDATQATSGSQPKIVDAGSLLTAGVTFDGSDDHFDFTEISNSGAFSLFIASAISNNGGFVLGDDSSVASFVRYKANDLVTRISNTDYSFGAGRQNSVLDIININRDGSNSLSVNRNGTTMGSAQTATGTFIIDLIGTRVNLITPMLGGIKELIIYNSDESANRPALETNIINHYGIS